MSNNQELQELNDILKQQIVALKELIALKDQVIAAKSVQPFIQQTPLFPQPYQPAITYTYPHGSGAGGTTQGLSGTTYTIKLFAGSLVMDSPAIKLATNNVRNIV